MEALPVPEAPCTDTGDACGHRRHIASGRNIAPHTCGGDAQIRNVNSGNRKSAGRNTARSQHMDTERMDLMLFIFGIFVGVILCVCVLRLLVASKDA